jgi:hypothetical protein
MNTFIERRDGRYWIVNPGCDPDGGMTVESGPFFTRWGARLFRRIWL